MSNRKLDALFAERVLGDPKPDWQCKHNLDRSSPGRAWVCVSDPHECEHDWRPAKFTTSLDAAWPGVEKLDAPTFVKFWFGYEDRDIRAEIDTDSTYEGIGDHPALALVKARLLSVGVTQEEIDAAV